MENQQTLHDITSRDKTKTPEKLAEMGCQFVVSPDVFLALTTLVDRCLEGSNDQQTTAFLLKLKGLLETTTVPVRAKTA